MKVEDRDQIYNIGDLVLFCFIVNSPEFFVGFVSSRYAYCNTGGYNFVKLSFDEKIKYDDEKKFFLYDKKNNEIKKELLTNDIRYLLYLDGYYIETFWNQCISLKELIPILSFSLLYK